MNILIGKVIRDLRIGVLNAVTSLSGSDRKAQIRELVNEFPAVGRTKKRRSRLILRAN